VKNPQEASQSRLDEIAEKSYQFEKEHKDMIFKEFIIGTDYYDNDIIAVIPEDLITYNYHVSGDHLLCANCHKDYLVTKKCNECKLSKDNVESESMRVIKKRYLELAMDDEELKASKKIKMFIELNNMEQYGTI